MSAPRASAAPTPDPVPVRIALESLRSRLCPACAGYKAANRSLCLPCYRRLSDRSKAGLYRIIGGGYETALAAALEDLRVAAPHWPGDRS